MDQQSWFASSNPLNKRKTSLRLTSDGLGEWHIGKSSASGSEGYRYADNRQMIAIYDVILTRNVYISTEYINIFTEYFDILTKSIGILTLKCQYKSIK